MSNLRTPFMRRGARRETSALEIFMEDQDTSIVYPENVANVAILAAVEHDGDTTSPIYRDEEILGTLVCGVVGRQVEISQVVVGETARREEVVAALGVRVIELEAFISGTIPSAEREEEIFDQVIDLSGMRELLDSNA